MIARGIIIAGIIIGFALHGIYGALFFLSVFLLGMLVVSVLHRSYYRSNR